MARDLEHQDMLEFFAALAPWAVFNVNRAKDVAFLQPQDFMLRRRARLLFDADEPPEAEHQPLRQYSGRPARLLAPVPPQGRCAIKGERPPSKYAPGQSDGVIERFDAYAQAFHSGKVKRYGR